MRGRGSRLEMKASRSCLSAKHVASSATRMWFAAAVRTWFVTVAGAVAGDAAGLVAGVAGAVAAFAAVAGAVAAVVAGDLRNPKSEHIYLKYN